VLKKILAVILSVSALTLVFSCSKSGDEKLQIYQIKYADSMYPKKYIFQNYKGDEKSPFAWKFYYISLNGIKILIDTGFNNTNLIKMYNIQNFKDPVEILKENGINPEEITDIIITHHHFDHIGSVHKFKNSNIYIQKDEFNAFFKLRGLQEIKNFLKNSNRVIKFQDSIKLYDSITVENIGGHSIGSSVVFLRLDKMEFCFTGDEIINNKNAEDKIGIGAYYNKKKNLEFINRLSKGNYKLLNFHEPDFNNFDKNFVQIHP